MVQKRFTVDDKTDKSQSCNSGDFIGCNDSIKCNALKGYLKFFKLILFFVIVILIRMYVIDCVNVIGSSMENTFLEGDVLIVKKFDLDDIQRDDVVIAKMGKQKVIKRVVALPNETIQIVDGTVLINGEKIEKGFDVFTEKEGVAGKPFVLKENEYFLMGDNRDESADSRDYGSVGSENIKGIVVFRCFPFNRIENLGERVYD